MVISTADFIQDVTLFLKNDLVSGVTDPIQATRPSGEKFILTSYPQRVVNYPLITIKTLNISTIKLGMSSEMVKADVLVEIRVWARNMKELDDLSQDVINRLRSIQLDANGSSANNLYGFKLGSSNLVLEETVKSRVMQFSYSVYLGV